MFTTILFYLLIIFFVVLMAAAWLSNLFGLPGNWIMLVLAIGWHFLIGTESAAHIGWQLLIVFTLLSAIGELLEFLASVLGTKKVGGGKKAAVCSIIGSIIGSFAGAFFGIPIPIPLVGMIIGSVLFACVGALVGATIGERWQGSKMDQSLKVGGAAFAGRFVGTMGKISMGSAMLVITIICLFV